MLKDVISVENLTKEFKELRAVDDLSFQVKEGEILGLLGPNGSGKSTMIKLMNGLLSKDSGIILINGLKPSKETKKIVSYLPERTYLNDWMKVKDILEFFKDFYSDFDMEKAEEMLKS